MAISLARTPSPQIQALHGQRAEMERRMEEQRREAEQAKQALAGRVAALLEHITVLDAQRLALKDTPHFFKNPRSTIHPAPLDKMM